MRPDRLRIVLSGMVAGVPHQGGASWAVLQWVLGLRRLGHEVVLAEPVAALSPEVCTYFDAVCSELGLNGSAALVAPDAHAYGLPYARVAAFARDADLVLNIAGMLADPELVEPAPVRAYVDLDPAFTQLWQAVEGIDMRLGGHTHFVTVGLNVGRPGCPVPTCGVPWLTTPPPVVLERWPVATKLSVDGFTTVGHWRGYGSIRRHGTVYGQKAHSWRPLVDLPTRSSEAFMPALAIHPDEVQDLAALEAHGWQLLDPGEVAATPAAYRSFVGGSKAELGIAKSGYVLSRSGWFSDRSACYLASGRPVIAQDTGFSEHLPTGAGLLAFGDADEALVAIEEVTRDYDRHRAAARRVAESALDSDAVLGDLLERLGTR